MGEERALPYQAGNRHAQAVDQIVWAAGTRIE
jgi:hypothetical protein